MDNLVDTFMSRDADSPIIPQEEDAVREWLSGDRIFHIMRDHPLHCVSILGVKTKEKKNTNDEVKTLLYTAQPSQKESHLNLMQVLKLALDSKSITPVQLDTTDFLSKIGASGVAGSPQQIALLRVIANLFCESTASRSFLVQLSSLRAFEIFFKATPHSHLASSCIREGQDVVVKQFISRNPTKPLIGEANLLFSSQSNCLTNPPCQLNSFQKLPIEAYSLLAADSLDQRAESYSNCSLSKRPRLDNTDHYQLPFILNTLAKIVADIGQLGPLPMWSKEEIKERVNTLNSYL
jgi:hypothetical protein